MSNTTLMVEYPRNKRDKDQPTVTQHIYSPVSDPEPKTLFMKPGFKTITLLFTAVFFPLIAFSIAILWLIFHHRVEPASSTQLDFSTALNEHDAAYYYVNFSATQLLFITSWSSTAAPILVGFIMTLSLFPISRKLLRDSMAGEVSRLPTPYQFSVLMGFAKGRMGTWWDYVRYGLKRRRARQSVGLQMSALIYGVALVLSTLIVIMDTVLHVTTDTVSIYETTVVESLSSNFGKGLNAACANWTESQDIFLTIPGIDRTEYYPCSVYVATTSEGLGYPDEVFRTLNSISSENQVLQVPTGNSTTGDLFLLGPAASSRSSISDYKATTIGVSTDCKALQSSNSGWSGQIEGPSYNPTALIQAGKDPTTFKPYNYTSLSNNFGLAIFNDPNLTSAYEIISYDLINTTHTTPNPFHLGIAALTASGATITSDPETITGGHGGHAFVLSCQVTTYDLTYTYYNNTISPASITAVLSNGTIGWNLLGPLSFQANRLAQMIDLAAVQSSSAALALSYGNQFSSLAVALLAGAYDGRTVLEEQIRDELLGPRVLKSAVWVLVVFDLLFALGGGGLAVWAFGVVVSGEGEAQALFSVEEVVGRCFEGREGGGKERVEGEGGVRVDVCARSEES